MKSSQVANIYLLELVSNAMPDIREGREYLCSELLEPARSRASSEFLSGCLKSLGSAIREARMRPLALTDEEAVLTS